MQKLGPSLVIICLLTLGGCGWGGPSYWLGQYQARIEHGSRTIEAAQDDTGRAAGHTERARGYAERARYPSCLIRKLSSMNKMAAPIKLHTKRGDTSDAPIPALSEIKFVA
jgi:hypothetical protein